LTQLDYKIFGLEIIKDQYVHDADFKDVLLHCKDGETWNKFIFNDEFVFQVNKLCIPASSIRLLLLQEAYWVGLMGHFGVKKTEDILTTHFFWPKMRRGVMWFVARCTTHQKAKSRLNPHDLKPYLGQEDELESRTTQMQQGEDDVDINTSDTSTPTHNQISALITRARACQQNNQVSSFLASYSSYLDNGNVHSILLLRNDGHEGNEVAFTAATFGFLNSSSLWRPPRPCMDLDSGVQILSGKLLEHTFICIKPQVHII
jgi:hypothetical protein